MSDSQALRKIYEFGPIPRLRREAPLSSTDIDQIPSLVMEAEAELRKCEAELIKFRTIVRSLERTKKEIEEAITATKSLLSPIHKLPEDVLVEILTQTDMTILIRDEAWIVPVHIFRAVCSSWRQMLSRKIFWASIDLRVEEKISNYRKALLQDLLVRSGDAPLHLTINCSYDSDIEDMLNPHTHRMKHLRLADNHSGVGADGGLALLYNSLPTLTALELSDPAIQPDQGEQIIETPNLRNVSYDIYYTPPSFTLPWAQLSQLSLWVYSTMQLLQLLSQCNSLQSLECNACFILGGMTEDSLPCVSLFNLTTVAFCLIYDEDYQSMSHCFAKLTLPSLTSLRIHATPNYVQRTGNGAKWPSDAFSSFLGRSKCKITTLALERFPLSHPILQNVLEKLLTLRHLKLIKPEPVVQRTLNGEVISPLITDELVEMLGATAPSESEAREPRMSPSSSDVKVEEQPPLSLVPFLESVELAGFCSSDQFSFPKFLQIIGSRSTQKEKERRDETGQSSASGAGASLKRVTVCRWSKQVVESAELEEIERLEKMGVRLSLSDKELIYY
jgi:hypothetical protein